jgi:type IV pilus assembly protein PilA
VDRRRREDGFTLVELLVVVIIIAILAAISTASFISQRDKAFISDVQASLRNAATSAEGIATFNDGNYSSVSPVTLDAEGLNLAASQAIAVPVASTTDYCIEIVDTRLSGHAIWSTGKFNSTTGSPQPGTC